MSRIRGWKKAGKPDFLLGGYRIKKGPVAFAIGLISLSKAAVGAHQAGIGGRAKISGTAAR